MATRSERRILSKKAYYWRGGIWNGRIVKWWRLEGTFGNLGPPLGDTFGVTSTWVFKISKDWRLHNLLGNLFQYLIHLST